MPKRKSKTTTTAASYPNHHHQPQPSNNPTARGGIIESSDDHGNLYWVVDRIVDCRERGGGFEYRMRWANWKGQDTWEPESYLSESLQPQAHIFRMLYLERKARRHCVFCHENFDSRIPFGCVAKHVFETNGDSRCMLCFRESFSSVQHDLGCYMVGAATHSARITDFFNVVGKRDDKPPFLQLFRDCATCKKAAKAVMTTKRGISVTNKLNASRGCTAAANAGDASKVFGINK